MTAELLTPKADLLGLLHEKEQRLARSNLYDFARYVAPAEYQFSWHHAVLYRWLDDFAKGSRRRIIIEMPPGTGKSEGCSRNLPAFIFGTNPDSRIIACSYTQDLASEMNRDVQRVMDSSRFGELFPGIRLGQENVRMPVIGKPRRNTDVFDIPGRRGIYKAAGVGVGISGRRFDRGIIDDPIKDREEANSTSHRERVWRWFTSVFCKRQARGAGILITTTRWHDDDLVGRIKRKMATGDIEPYDILTLPSIAVEPIHPDDERQPGEPLWPWLRPLAELQMMQRTEPRDFYALEQQDPRAEGDQEWPATMFPASMWFDDWPPSISLLVIALDPSKGKSAKHGDYSAFIVLGRTPDGTLWIEADLSRRPTTQIVADGIELARRVQAETKAHLDAFGVETNSFQELLADDIKRQTKATGVMLPIHGINNAVNKEVRIRRLTPYLSANNIRIRATPGGRLLVRQLQEFPVGDHDDGPDALEMALRLAKEMSQRKHNRR